MSLKSYIARLERVANGDYTDFLSKAGVTIRSDVVKGVLASKDLQGGEIKKNSDKWAKYKASKGWGNRSLEAKERLLISPSTYDIKAGRKNVEVSIKPVREAIVGYLLNKGYKFFGIREITEQKITRDWHKYLRDLY